MKLEEARQQAQELFSDIGPPSAAGRLVVVGRQENSNLGFFEQLTSMTPSGFPIPALLLIGFAELLGVTPYGPGEKLQWGLDFDFRGSTFGFQYRKLGLRALCEPR